MTKRTQGKRPTQTDVAQAAGVSQALVSYVLNGAQDVSVPEETRQRILDAVAKLGYVPNRNARSLRTNKSYILASIIPDITNPFYPELERGIQETAEQNGYGLMIYNTDGNDEKERNALQAVIQTRADGLIGTFFHRAAPDFQPLLESGTAIVLLENCARSSGDVPLDCLYVDNVRAARTAVEYLIGRGYRRIGTLAAREGPGKPRLAGYRQALALHGIDVDDTLVAYGDFMEESGYQGMRQLLQIEPPLQAVFAANDMTALGALLAIKEAGLSIPKDIALIGFDDIALARLVEPPLTTVTQFQRRVGQRAAEMLFERLAGTLQGGGRCEEMPFQLVIRRSA
jgi:LacI family transcriptional regulator